MLLPFFSVFVLHFLRKIFVLSCKVLKVRNFKEQNTCFFTNRTKKMNIFLNYQYSALKLKLEDSKCFSNFYLQ